MITVEQREAIRRAYYLEHKSVRQIAREQRHSRKTVDKAIAQAQGQDQAQALGQAQFYPLYQPYPYPTYRRTKPRPAPVFGSFQDHVDELLQQNDCLPRKQRYTARKIFELLVKEGYQGSESRVRLHVSRYRKAHHAPALFIPLEFDPGKDAQVDWGEAVAVITGERQTVQLFIMRLNYSRRSFVMAFPSQKQEAFFAGHVAAFHHFGGVPQRISYDNLATAVSPGYPGYQGSPAGPFTSVSSVRPMVEGRVRREQRAFVAFRSHYLFESHFCTPGQGHEKGGVEHSVGFSRRNFLVPIPNVASFEALNTFLLSECLRDDGRRVARQPTTIKEAWEQERTYLQPLPSYQYECCVTTYAHLTPYSQVIFETNRYSVPVERARREAIVKAYPFHVDIFDPNPNPNPNSGQPCNQSHNQPGLPVLPGLLARHPRCYKREQDIFEPLHYLPLLAQRPGAFDYAKPLRRWRARWPPTYEKVLALLREEWPEGRGVKEFVRILQLHQDYPAALVERAVGQALSYGCVHFDGVTHCLRQLTTPDTELTVLAGLDLVGLADHPHLQTIGNIGSQPIDLRRYEQLLQEAQGLHGAQGRQASHGSQGG
jgi:transposase